MSSSNWYHFSEQSNQLKSAWASIVTRSKQQKQKLVEEKSLNQILPNIDKVAKQVKSLKASLSFEALPTSKPQLDNLISSFNEAKSKLETIEDETESVAKAGQKLLRTGNVFMQTFLSIRAFSSVFLILSRYSWLCFESSIHEFSKCFFSSRPSIIQRN